jgi:hypothetical protein
MVYANETNRSSTEMTLTPVGCGPSRPLAIWTVDWFTSDVALPLRSRMCGSEVISITRPNGHGAGGPLKVLEYSSRFECTRYSLTDDRLLGVEVGSGS